MAGNNIPESTAAYLDSIEPALMDALAAGERLAEDVRSADRDPSVVASVVTEDITKALVRLVPGAESLRNSGNRSWVLFPDFALLRVKCTRGSWIGRNLRTASAVAFVTPTIDLPGIPHAVPRLDFAYQFSHQTGTITAAALVYRNADAILWERRLPWAGAHRTTVSALELPLVPQATVRPKRRRDEQATG